MGMIPRLLLVRLRPDDLEIDRARLKVHLWPAQREDRFLAPAGIEAEQDEQRQVEPGLWRPRRPDQPSGFVPGKPAIARFGALGQLDRNGPS